MIPQMWRLILTKLRGSNFDLLQARLVCRQWKTFVDEIISEVADDSVSSCWKFEFVSRPGTELWLGKNKKLDLVATRFSKWAQLRDLMDHFPKDKNPFPTGVVILTKYFGGNSPNRLDNLTGRVSAFLTRFGKRITTLVIFFHPSKRDHDPGTYPYPMETLLKILEKCDGLRNLFPYSEEGRVWLPENWSFPKTETETPNGMGVSSRLKLNQLVIQTIKDPLDDSGDYCGGIPPIVRLARLPSVMESITSLDFEWISSDSVREKFERKLQTGNLASFFNCPNLEQLKIARPTANLFEYFCKGLSSAPQNLKHVHFDITGPPRSGNNLSLPALMKLLDSHASTLTSFTLVKKRETFWEDERLVDTTVQFPKLKQLTIHSYMVACKEFHPVISSFGRKFTALEELTILGTHYSIVLGTLGGRRIVYSLRTRMGIVKKAIDRIWSYFSETLAFILMPDYDNLRLERGELLSLEMMANAERAHPKDVRERKSYL